MGFFLCPTNKCVEIENENLQNYLIAIFFHLGLKNSRLFPKLVGDLDLSKHLFYDRLTFLAH